MLVRFSTTWGDISGISHFDGHAAITEKGFYLQVRAAVGAQVACRLLLSSAPIEIPVVIEGRALRGFLISAARSNRPGFFDAIIALPTEY